MLKWETRVLLGVGLLFGAALLAWEPPCITYDGPSHFYRTVQVASGGFRPVIRSETDVGGQIPSRDSQFLNALWTGYWSRHDFGHWADWQQVARDALPATGASHQSFTNCAIYSPLNYGFQALGFRIAAACTPSPLIGERLACLANLVGFLGLMALAIEWLPSGGGAIVVLATSPVALTQAAAVSADPINFALPVMLVAGIASLRMAAGAQRGRALVCLGLIPLVVLLKPVNGALVLAAAWIPIRHFGSRARKWISLGIAGGIAVAAWWWWNHPYLQIDLPRFFDPAAPSSRQIKDWFRANPARFLPALSQTFRFTIWDQWPGAFGAVGGWISPAAQAALVPLSLLCLVGASAGSLGARRRPDFPWIGALIGQAAAFTALLALVLWLTYAQVGEPTSPVFGHAAVPWLGGRYLEAAYLMVALAFGEGIARWVPRVTRHALWAGLAANAWFLVLLLEPLARHS